MHAFMHACTHARTHTRVRAHTHTHTHTLSFFHNATQAKKVGNLKALVKVGKDNGLPLRVTGALPQRSTGAL
jgi:hypothetical protein